MGDEEKLSNGTIQCLGDTLFRGFEAIVPKGWSMSDRFSYISVSKENLRVHFKGQNEGHKEGASVRATHPIPPACGLFYFEVKIVSKGREGGVAVGLSTQFACLDQLPGTEQNSYGYHGTDGFKYHNNEPGQGKAYGPSFTTGDVIGVGLNFTDNSCFFTKNGHHLGVAFSDLPRGWELYPTVGLQSVGGMIDANFGQHPFMFDVEDMKKELGMVMRNVIDQVPLPDMSTNNPDICFDMEKVVMTYLLHNGYCGTASAFASATGQDVTGEVDVVNRRQQVLSLVMEGQISQAMELTELYYPGLLDDQPNLHLVLRVRQFVEVVSGADSKYHCEDSELPEPPRRSVIMGEAMETDCGDFSNGLTNGHNKVDAIQQDELRGSTLERILDCGRKLHSWHARLATENTICDQYRDMVRDAFSLIAYADPHSSPVGWQLEPSQREVVADLLREAILRRTNVNNKTVLESAVNYAKELLRLMEAYGIGKVAFVKFNDVVN
ncbi:hypothetical protein GE061_013482 [Apolygus lucorum]|uniref:B30.2/SPRY domain-containing protein n=1 Tax=Apolygus lucorum TaxID=248454 RepID=A0A8S9XQ55_APOLU|nr:hypothetical protein GE061_013482 [Apolygus lucorum]